MKPSEIAKKLGMSSSTLQRYRLDMNMLPPYKIPPPNSHKKQNISDNEHNLDRPQMISNDLKRPQMASNDSEVKPIKTKNNVKGVGKIQIDDK